MEESKLVKCIIKGVVAAEFIIAATVFIIYGLSLFMPKLLAFTDLGFIGFAIVLVLISFIVYQVISK